MASRLIVLIFVAPYRSKAMLSSKCIYAPDAGNSPRKPGSLPMIYQNFVASLHTARSA